MLKITGGELKGRNVVCPEGKDIRPTSSMARQGIFNTLFSLGFNINNSSILELFAGTGLISFEGISRGAKRATLIDNSRNSVDVILSNIKKLGLEDRTKVENIDALRFLEVSDLSSYDPIYLDPPYIIPNYSQILDVMLQKINKTCIIVAENEKDITVDIKEKYKLLKSKSWGRNMIFFIQRL